MAREPHYPEEAAVGADGKPAPDQQDEGAAAASGQPGSKRTKHLVAGAAIGIGSAAIVAALLYANRSRDRKS